MRYSFLRLIEKLGKDFPVKKIWIPEIKQYQIERLNQGAASSTINKEKVCFIEDVSGADGTPLDGR